MTDRHPGKTPGISPLGWGLIVVALMALSSALTLMLMRDAAGLCRF